MPSGSYGTPGVWDPEGGPAGFVLASGEKNGTGERINLSCEFGGFAFFGLNADS